MLPITMGEPTMISSASETVSTVNDEFPSAADECGHSRQCEGLLAVRHHRIVRAILRQIAFDPDPRTLPDDAASFEFGARLMVGPRDGPGEESFGLTVCSPEWLAERCRDGVPVDGLHHVIVDWESFDERVLRRWLEDRVHAVEAATWQGIANRLCRLGWWEFEGYQEHT